MLKLDRISKAYKNQPILQNLSFELAKGQIGCLLGPSGCGKTTALRLIAGFEAPENGSIQLGEHLVTQTNNPENKHENPSQQSLVQNPNTTTKTTVTTTAIHITPAQRRVGVVFQDYALFPHLSVAENIAFGLHRWNRKEKQARVETMLELVGLTNKAEQLPHTLSGGQQQRVALARALAPKPCLLLLDEPFSSLDVELREKLSIEVRDILKQEGMTALLVTHDQHEAFAIADVIGVMHEGQLAQWDTPYNLYHRPNSRFVADFIGQGVFLTGVVENSGQIRIELGTLHEEQISILPHQTPAQTGQQVNVLLRPDDIQHDDLSPLQAEVERKAFRGAEFLYTLKLPSGQRVLSLVPSHHNHALGEKIGIRLDVDHVVAFQTQNR